MQVGPQLKGFDPHGGLVLVLVATTLIGYHTFVYDLSLLCPVLLVSAITGCKDSQVEPGTRKLLMVGAGTLLCAPLYLIAMQVLGRLNIMGIFLLALTLGWGRAVAEWKRGPSWQSTRCP